MVHHPPPPSSEYDEHYTESTVSRTHEELFIFSSRIFLQIFCTKKFFFGGVGGW
jgi:hypothetical protein